MRASTSGRVLDHQDAALVKGMINRGDRQHDIAAYFGVNGGRIGETSTGDQFSGVVAATSNLPPASPYLVISGGLLHKARAIMTALEAGTVDHRVISDLKLIIEAMDASRIARHGV